MQEKMFFSRDAVLSRHPEPLAGVRIFCLKYKLCCYIATPIQAFNIIFNIVLYTIDLDARKGLKMTIKSA